MAKSLFPLLLHRHDIPSSKPIRHSDSAWWNRVRGGVAIAVVFVVASASDQSKSTSIFGIETYPPYRCPQVMPSKHIDFGVQLPPDTSADGEGAGVMKASENVLGHWELVTFEDGVGVGAAEMEGTSLILGMVSMTGELTAGTEA